MKRYRVEFAIDVSAETPEKACQIAWENLTQPDSFLPIGTVTDECGEGEDVDLQELAQSQ